ncbi:LEA type 2 family protein [Methylicorpusculum sp.]|uniref:LEA type 2 family protein n=1 Tax=Methylicorpusculum sp. TaxID=2713644 RepID=UPI002718DE7F|nr:LEA type 2 family protein [Methylicorpusculum sp.]MDO9241392.1 LEA type 2 family protein [Methylicorpusculum sp.]MDP2179535.1 LEA type 2 family protein [Methylicorpusculum sp.]MDP3529788.1 LEA type 2 family protein [Methylicorpusculum sp.]MDZ4151239.1 LEA type 2 family protein [Methylicorpusculum sp.]
MKKIKLIGIVFFTLWLSACSYFVSDFKTPHLSLVGISPIALGLFEQRFKLKLRVQNPNDAALSIKGMQYFLDVEGYKFAQGVSDQEITIPEFGDQVMSLPVSSNLSVLLRLLKRARHEKLSYELRGDIQLANQFIKLPFNYKGKFDLKL